MSLNEIFAAIWEEQGGGLTPEQLRDKAFPRIPPDDYADLLYDVMYGVCHNFVNQRRHDRPKKEAADAATSATVSARSSSSRSQPAGQANAARSSKHRSLRERWPILQGSYALTGGPGAQRKNLESMSAEECALAARVNRTIADGNIRAAEWLELVGSELVKANAAVVAKLPPAVLTRLQNNKP